MIAMQSVFILFGLIISVISSAPHYNARSVSAGTSCEVNNDVVNPSPLPDPISPEKYYVTWDVNVEVDGKPADPIVLEVTRSWAPLGSDRFYSLVNDGFFNGAAFFRVVPDFVLQFGISALPEETAKWDTEIFDDPVLVSNKAWTVSYATAGPNTRTSQIFINYIDNAGLDDQGFAPFAKVISGFETALNVVNPTPDSSNGVNQKLYKTGGNEWILGKYPDISLISCTLISDDINTARKFHTQGNSTDQ